MNFKIDKVFMNCKNCQRLFFWYILENYFKILLLRISWRLFDTFVAIKFLNLHILHSTESSCLAEKLCSGY